MAALDTRSDRYWYGLGNLVLATFCIPICYGLPSKDFASLKFASAIAGTVLGLNSVRLLSEHSEAAGVRAAWRTSQEMVSGAWIEDMAIANLPPSYRVPVYQPVGETENYYLPIQPPHFQPIAENPQPERPPERGSDRRMPNLSAYNAVLVCGVPGTGKTTLARIEIKKRLSLGHEVIVLDPHAAYGAWQGCEIIGGGMDYKAIDTKLNWLFEEIKKRYSRIENEPNPHLPPLTIVAEEFTQWSTKVKSSSDFFWASNTDIRKIEIFVLFVNHTRTLIATGGAKGAAQLRDDNLLEVQLQGEMNEDTGRATPLYQALVKMPGKTLSERYLVLIERSNSQPSHSVDRHQPGSEWKLPQRKAESPESLYGIEAEGYSVIVVQILAEPGKLVLFSDAVALPDEEKVKIAKIVINQNLGTENTILCFWGVKSGGRNHQLYAEAKKMLDRLIEQINNSRGDV